VDLFFLSPLPERPRQLGYICQRLSQESRQQDNDPYQEKSIAHHEYLIKKRKTPQSDPRKKGRDTTGHVTVTSEDLDLSYIFKRNRELKQVLIHKSLYRSNIPEIELLRIFFIKSDEIVANARHNTIEKI